MLSKTLIIAAAALGLTAGAALADGSNYPDKVLTPAERQSFNGNSGMMTPQSRALIDAQAAAGAAVVAPATGAAVNASAIVPDQSMSGPLIVVRVGMGPVPDTPRNRAAYGGPDSHGGRMTAPAGN